MNVNVTKEQLDKIKRVNIRIFLEDKYGCVFHGTNCLCPHPDHDDKHPSFSVWNSGSYYYWCCHACHVGKTNLAAVDKNYGTDIIGLVRWLSDYKGSEHVYSFQEAAVIVMNYAGIGYTATAMHGYQKLNLHKIAAESCCRKLLADPSHDAYKYLLKRGLSDKDMKKWLLGYNGIRLTFPLLDKNSNVLAFSNRIIGTAAGPKYMNSQNDELFDKSQYLYGAHLLPKDVEQLYVSEGQFDVILAEKFGLKNVVSILGCAFNDKHIKYIKENFPKVTKLVFVYDNDLAGLKAMKRSAEIARAEGFSALYCLLPEGQDLCDFALENKFNTAKKIESLTRFYFYYQLEKDIADYEAAILNAQSVILEKALPILNTIRNVNEHQAAQTFLKSRFGISLSEEEEKCLNL